MNSPVISLGDADGFPMSPDNPSQNFGAVVSPVGSKIGLTGLGAMYVTVEPGKRAFPYHNHLGNDEMFVVLEGSGTYRFGGQSYSVTAGDVCGAPRGGPDTAHQLINTGTEPLRYLGISTSNDPDVVEYPDSDKFAAIAVAPGQSFFEAHLKVVAKRADGRDYWEGEDL